MQSFQQKKVWLRLRPGKEKFWEDWELFWTGNGLAKEEGERGNGRAGKNQEKTPTFSDLSNCWPEQPETGATN